MCCQANQLYAKKSLASRVSNLKKCPVKRKRGTYSDLSDNIILLDDSDSVIYHRQTVVITKLGNPLKRKSSWLAALVGTLQVAIFSMTQHFYTASA